LKGRSFYFFDASPIVASLQNGLKCDLGASNSM